MSMIPIYSAERQPSPSKLINVGTLAHVGTLAAIVVLTVGLAVLRSAAPAIAQTIDAPEHKPGTTTKTEMVPSLIVMNAQGASLQGETLTLNGVAPSTIVFADRPVRAAGHKLTAHLVEGWGKEGEGFVKDPPNATVSVFSKGAATVHDAVVVLKTPKLVGDRLTFAVRVLEGDLAGADGPASIFIDTADFEVSALQSMFPSTNWPPSMRH
jgi:hypothetical protein